MREVEEVEEGGDGEGVVDGGEEFGHACGRRREGGREGGISHDKKAESRKLRNEG